MTQRRTRKPLSLWLTWFMTTGNNLFPVAWKGWVAIGMLIVLIVGIVVGITLLSGGQLVH